MASKFTRSNSAGWLMAGPAAFLMALFVVVPFLFAILLSFTNQRLVSPTRPSSPALPTTSSCWAWA